MPIATVTSKGQIVIPAKIRKSFGIKAGTKLGIEAKNNEFVVRLIDPNYFENLAGTLKTRGRLTKSLLQSRKEDEQREL